jgi:hypothetical protein
MAELLFDWLAHAMAARVASARKRQTMVRVGVLGVIDMETKARPGDVFAPVMIRDVYPHVS